MICGMADVTQILNAIEQGDPAASEQLLPLVYDELRGLARQKLAHEKPGQTLQATALVHEAYLRLVGSGQPPQQQEWIVMTAGIVATLPPLLLGLGMFAKALSAIGALVSGMHPMVLAIIAIAGAITTLILTNEDVRAKFIEIWKRTR